MCLVYTTPGQLLSLAIQHEQPELEARKAQLLQEQSSQKLQLSELEKQLLQALATSRCGTLVWSGLLRGDCAACVCLCATPSFHHANVKWGMPQDQHWPES